MTFRLQVPRPSHTQSNESEQLAWKKTSNTSQHTSSHLPRSRNSIMVLSEHRLGLKPILRRVYVPEGETPIANVNWRYQWLWLYAFVHPKTGETYWWILPYVNTKLFNQVLADFAREFGLGAKKHILLVVEQAGWHISRDLKIPQGLHLTFLPSYSPELQPAERLWALVDEAIANQSFATLDDLEDVLFHRCQSLLQHKKLI